MAVGTLACASLQLDLLALPRSCLLLRRADLFEIRAEEGDDDDDPSAAAAAAVAELRFFFLTMDESTVLGAVKGKREEAGKQKEGWRWLEQAAPRNHHRHCDHHDCRPLVPGASACRVSGWAHVRPRKRRRTTIVIAVVMTQGTISVYACVCTIECCCIPRRL